MDNMNIAQNTAITESPLEITNKTTLGELLITLGLEPGQKRKGKTPTRAKLIASAEPFVKKGDITLYNSGFALYENGIGRHSVVWIPYCVNFTYYFNQLRDAEKDYLKERAEVPDKALIETPWATIVALFGEERITQSMNRGFGNAEEDNESDQEEYEPGDEDMEGMNFVWDDEVFGTNPLNVVIRRENRKEMLASMTEKQREVFVLYHKYDCTQQQIAEVIGISRDSVNDRLEGAYKKARMVIQNAR